MKDQTEDFYMALAEKHDITRAQAKDMTLARFIESNTCNLEKFKELMLKEGK